MRLSVHNGAMIYIRNVSWGSVRGTGIMVLPSLPISSNIPGG
jgi:hypothetical protein